MVRYGSRLTAWRMIGALALVSIGSISWLSGQEPAAPVPTRDAVRERLQSLQGLVGEWRGIGQPRRGSNKGAWRESADVRWQWQPEASGLAWAITDGKLWRSALFTVGTDPQSIELRVTVDDQTSRTYTGRRESDKLVLETDAAEEEVHRLTLTWLGDDRVVLLAEKRTSGQSFPQRVAEVAYQREGTRLAAQGASGPECVVTGGVGTIKVTHAGKTYYVCCTGCRDAFNDDPEGILAEYAARKAEEAKK